MKKNIIIFFVLILILTSLSSCNAGENNNDNGSGKNLENEVDVMEFDDGLYLDIRNKEDKNSLGVWWWDINDIKQADDLYLNFLEKNNVSEIYLHAYNYQNHGITDDDMKSFVKKAGEKGMRVAYLCGDYSWIIPGNTAFNAVVSHFNEYQKKAEQNEKFYALHLDVEPHQHPDFAAQTQTIMQYFADFLMQQAYVAAKEADTLLEWDIPFWLTHIVKDSDDKDINAAELFAIYCDTISIMSYRDTAEAMLDISKEEIEIALTHGCKIVLGAETYSEEGDFVSYMEEGKEYMYEELAKLNKMLEAKISDKNYGIAIHWVRNWYNLKLFEND